MAGNGQDQTEITHVEQRRFAQRSVLLSSILKDCQLSDEGYRVSLEYPSPAVKEGGHIDEHLGPR